MSDLFDYAPPPLDFDGETYEPPRDQVRLTGQALRVWKVMQDGKWRTLPQISVACFHLGRRDSEAAISARLRDFRKERFGGHVVEREHINDGLWRYRLIVTEETGR